MTFAVIRDLVLFLLALYGALLSTFNWLQAVRKERRKIKMSVSSAAPTYGDQIGPWFVRIAATNIGHRAVTISGLQLELPGGARLFSVQRDAFPGIPDTPVPVTLTDGQTAHSYLSYLDLTRALMRDGRTGKTKLTPVCEDSAGGVHRGKPWNVDFESLSRLLES